MRACPMHVVEGPGHRISVLSGLTGLSSLLAMPKLNTKLIDDLLWAELDSCEDTSSDVVHGARSGTLSSSGYRHPYETYAPACPWAGDA